MRTAVFLFAGLVATLCTGAHAAVLAPTGPDAFGYQGSAIASNLRNISSTGTFLPLADDVISGPINIGFSFNFYDAPSATQVDIGSNGFLRLISDNFIHGFSADLNNPQGNIRYQTLGSPGSREFVVGFYNVARFLGQPSVTFEMILKEGSNDIEFQYGSMNMSAGGGSVGIREDFSFTLLANNSNDNDFSHTGYLITRNAATTPEPATLAIWGGLAFVGLAVRLRRKQRATV